MRIYDSAVRHYFLSLKLTAVLIGLFWPSRSVRCLTKTSIANLPNPGPAPLITWPWLGRGRVLVTAGLSRTQSVEERLVCVYVLMHQLLAAAAISWCAYNQLRASYIINTKLPGPCHCSPHSKVVSTPFPLFLLASFFSPFLPSLPLFPFLAFALPSLASVYQLCS